MKRLANCLWQDEHGVILSAEIVIVGSVLVIGLITGMTCLQDAVNGEMNDLADAIGSLDQSYSFSGQVGDKRCPVRTAGSCYQDCEERCDDKRGDIVAGNCEHACLPCGTGGCLDTSCGDCGSYGCQGGCGSCADGGYGYQPKARCVSTGVPHMKVQEWPGISATAVPSNCDPCQAAIDDKKPFFNIPDSVW